MRQGQGLLVGLLLCVVAMAGCGGQSGTTQPAATDVSGVGGASGTGGGGMGGMGGMGGDTGGGGLGGAPMGGPMMGQPGDMTSPAPGGAAPAAPAADQAQISAQRKLEAQESKAEGDQLLKEGEYDSAITQYELALVDDPENQDIKRSIERAKRMKAEAQRREVQQLVSRGRSLFYQGEYIRAASVLEQAVQKDPRHSEALGYLIATGMALKSLQDYGFPQPGMGQPGAQGAMQGGEGGGLPEAGGGAMGGAMGGGMMGGMRGGGAMGGGMMGGMGGGRRGREES